MIDRQTHTFFADFAKSVLQTGAGICRVERGFTIMELMFALVIAATLVALAAPGFQTLIRNSRTTAEFNRFMGDVAFARSEAITRGRSVSLCPSADYATCNSADWSDGWIAFVDDGSGAGGVEDNRRRDGDEILLRVGESTRGMVSITSTGFIDANGVMLSRDGTMEGGVTANIGRFTICDDQGDLQKAKGITFSAFGQMRQMRDTDSNGIVDYGAGPTDVVCPPP